jgi:hypothetical protein
MRHAVLSRRRAHPAPAVPRGGPPAATPIPALADAAAAAIELLHCASLVHDDLPCFDDAPTRRGRAVGACAYGERWPCWPATR